MDITNEFNVSNNQSIVLLEKKDTRTSRGMLSKAWYVINGKVCLVKGNSYDAYEPYSEVMAYKLGKFLGFDCIRYWLDDAHKYPEITMYSDCKHVSVCETFMHPGEVQEKFYGYLRDLYTESEISRIDIWNEVVKSTHLELPISKYLLFDALTGNEDRHLNNIDLVINKKIKSYIVSPIYDNGASLLAYCSDSDLNSAVIPYKLDKAKPFRTRHKNQIKLISKALVRSYFQSVNLQDILNIIQEELMLLDLPRAKAIKQYLAWRFEMIRRYGEDNV